MSRLLILLVLLHQWTGSSNAEIKVLNGQRPKCGGEICAPNAVCIEDQCKCSNEPNTAGNPKVFCYDKDSEWATFLSDDPLLKTLGEERGHVEFPCQYSLLNVTTAVKGDANKFGECDIKILPFNAKHGGKFYTLGFYLSVKVDLQNVTWEFISDVRGLVSGGMYVIRAETNVDTSDIFDNYDNAGAFYVEKIIDDQIISLTSVQYDPNHNYAFFDIESCGVYIAFRPYDAALARNQLFKSFLFVTVDKDSQPNFHDDENYNLALTPSTYLHQDSSSVQNKDHSILTRFLRTPEHAVVAKYNPYCLKGIRAYAGCSEHVDDDLLAKCTWILTTPKFMNCYDRTYLNGEDIMELFVLCLETVCACAESDCNNELCAKLQFLLDMQGCFDKGPMNVDLRNFNATVCVMK